MWHHLLPLVVLLLAPQNALSWQPGNILSRGLPQAYLTPSSNITLSDFFDLFTLFNIAVAQVFHATEKDTLPTNVNVFRLLSGIDLPTSTLTVCDRRDIGACVVRGNSSNGLPERLQGIFWTDGLSPPAQAFTSAGTWDPVQRRLVFPYSSLVVEPTSSFKQGLLWTPSGASNTNLLLSLGAFLDIIFDEEINFGQIRIGGYFLGYKIIIPPFIGNLTMEWVGDGSWKRRSGFLGIDITGGDYTLRRIINNDGTKTGFFPQWVEYANGSDIMVASIFKPSSSSAGFDRLGQVKPIGQGPGDSSLTSPAAARQEMPPPLLDLDISYPLLG